MPKTVIQQLKRQAEKATQALETFADDQERSRQASLEHRLAFGRWDAELDRRSVGPFWLQQPVVAGIVYDSLHYLNGRVYDLDAFCIMPNHVHAIFTPLEMDDGSYHPLQAIMHSLKRHTAMEANRALGRSGQFWQYETYDHLVRDDSELGCIRQYVLNNPVKAGLVSTWDE